METFIASEQIASARICVPSQPAIYHIGLRLLNPAVGFFQFRVWKQELARVHDPNAWRLIPELDIGDSKGAYRAPFPKDGRMFEWKTTGQPIGSKRQADFVLLALAGWHYGPGFHPMFFRRFDYVFANGHVAYFHVRAENSYAQIDAEVPVVMIVTNDRC
ncbi:hypothetical protein [Noviherbaspirillum saxi]|uniref:hypothetical protein n=1 Tax=Noviherbaspirillum saxi TaxID=2320863 RepID=UPI0011C48698|nr:hypothetical protein [Noviherbaspirillum saxi]